MTCAASHHINSKIGLNSSKNMDDEDNLDRILLLRHQDITQIMTEAMRSITTIRSGIECWHSPVQHIFVSEVVKTYHMNILFSSSQYKLIEYS